MLRPFANRLMFNEKMLKRGQQAKPNVTRQTFSKTDRNIAMFGENFNDSIGMNRKNFNFILFSTFLDHFLHLGQNVHSPCSATKNVHCHVRQKIMFRCGRSIMPNN